MRLQDYLEQTSMTEVRFAEWIGAPHSCVHKWNRQGVVPRPHYMRRIYVKTDGAVGPADFYDLPPLNSNARKLGGTGGAARRRTTKIPDAAC